MKKILSLSALVFFGLCQSAHASAIEITLGADSSSIAYGTGGSLSPNIDLASAVVSGNLGLTSNAFLISTPLSVVDEFLQPTGSIYGNTYVAVMSAPTFSTTGSALYTLGPNMDNFGFTWGTIDRFNTLVLTDSRNVVYTITGSDILSQLAGSIAGTTQSDVRFVDHFGGIVSAELFSVQNAFEAANFAQANMPLPAALPLFGMGLLGLTVLRRRKKSVV